MIGRRRVRSELIFFAANFMLFALITWGRDHPVVAADEIGFIGLARFISGTRNMFHMLTASYYSWGYPLILAPTYWITNSANASYQIGVLINAAMIGAMAVVLSRTWALLTGEWDKSRFIYAFIVVLYPAIQVNAGILWSEIAFSLLFSIIVLQLTQLVLRPSNIRAHVLCLLAVYLFAVHQRAILIPFFIVALVMYMAIERKISWWAWFSCLATTALGFYGVILLNNYFKSMGWSLSESNMFTPFLATMHGWRIIFQVARSAVGQFWYIGASTFGLLFIAIAYCFQNLNNARKSFIASRKGYFSEKGFRSEIVVAICLAFLCVCVVSIVALNDPTRADHYIYGRYIEGALPPILLIGFIGLRDVRQNLAWGFLLTFVCMLSSGSLALILSHVIPVSGKLSAVLWTTPATIALHMGHRLEATIAIGTMLMVVISSSMIFVARWKPWVSASMVGILFLVSGAGALHQLKHYGQINGQALRPIQRVASVVGPAHVDFDRSSLNIAYYFFLEAALPEWDISAETNMDSAPASLFFSSHDWLIRNDEPNAYKIVSTDLGNITLWYVGDPVQSPIIPLHEDSDLITNDGGEMLYRGMYTLERNLGEKWRWTNGNASIWVNTKKMPVCRLNIDVGAGGQNVESVTVKWGGRIEKEFSLGKSSNTKMSIELPPSKGITQLLLTSKTFVPGGGDQRALGVMLRSIKFQKCVNF